jgi:hypothetical protein
MVNVFDYVFECFAVHFICLFSVFVLNCFYSWVVVKLVDLWTYEVGELALDVFLSFFLALVPIFVNFSPAIKWILAQQLLNIRIFKCRCCSFQPFIESTVAYGFSFLIALEDVVLVVTEWRPWIASVIPPHQRTNL